MIFQTVSKSMRLSNCGSAGSGAGRPPPARRMSGCLPRAGRTGAAPPIYHALRLALVEHFSPRMAAEAGVRAKRHVAHFPVTVIASSAF
jgi:hypothetical protein